MASAHSPLLGISRRDVKAWACVAVCLGFHYLYTRATGGTPFWHSARGMQWLAPAAKKPLPPLIWLVAWSTLLVVSVCLAADVVMRVVCALQRSMEEHLAENSRGRDVAVDQLVAAAEPSPAQAPATAAAAAGGGDASPQQPPAREAARAAAARRCGAAEAAVMASATAQDPVRGDGDGAPLAAAAEPRTGAAPDDHAARPEQFAGCLGVRQRRKPDGEGGGGTGASGATGWAPAGPPGSEEQPEHRQRRAREALLEQLEAAPSTSEGTQQREARLQAAEEARQKLERHRAALQAAREAEERQRAWLQQGGGLGGLAGLEAAEQLQRDREVREEQDEAYLASSEADKKRQEAKEEAEARRRQQEQRRLELAQLKGRLREALPPEPSPSDPGVVAVRVRLPSGAAAQRLWDGGALVGAVTDWVQSLADLPVSWEPGSWCLATSMPRALLQDGARRLEEVSEGSKALALFVVQL